MGNKNGKEGQVGGQPTSVTADSSEQAGEWEERRNSYAKAFEPATDILNTKMTVQDFELLKVVGKGSFGKVYQVKHKATGKIYALKSLKKQQLLKRKQIAHTNTERKVLQNIESPFIVNLKFAFQSKDRLYLGLEYFTGGELFYHLKTGGRFGYSRARFYGMEICMALECLHDNGIIYRDLKPENLLLDDEGHIRLTDFGLSKDCILGNQETKTFCGTPEYLAPEVILGKAYTKAVDWWSYGTVVYEMTCGLPPFYHKNIKSMYERILGAQLRFPKGMSTEGRLFFTRLLDKNGKTRLGASSGASEVKAMDYFKGIDWKLALDKKIKPPFVPENEEGLKDTINVDPDFLRELPRETPMDKSQLASEDAQAAFPGFTYKDEQELGKQ